MIVRILVLSASLLLTAGYITRAARPEAIPPRESLEKLPLALGSWSGNDLPAFEQRVLTVLGVDDYVNRVYGKPSGEIAYLYVGYYKSQRQGDTIHSPLNCLPGSGWNPVNRGTLVVMPPDAGADPVRINRIAILKGTGKQLVLYWYQSHGRVIASEYWGKVYTVLDAMRTGRTDAALVRVVCPIADLSPESERLAEESALEFVNVLFPFLGRFLPV